MLALGFIDSAEVELLVHDALERTWRQLRGPAAEAATPGPDADTGDRLKLKPAEGGAAEPSDDQLDDLVAGSHMAAGLVVTATDAADRAWRQAEPVGHRGECLPGVERGAITARCRSGSPADPARRGRGTS